MDKTWDGGRWKDRAEELKVTRELAALAMDPTMRLAPSKSIAKIHLDDFVMPSGGALDAVVTRDARSAWLDRVEDRLRPVAIASVLVGMTWHEGVEAIGEVLTIGAGQ